MKIQALGSVRRAREHLDLYWRCMWERLKVLVLNSYQKRLKPSRVAGYVKMAIRLERCHEGATVKEPHIISFLEARKGNNYLSLFVLENVRNF